MIRPSPGKGATAFVLTHESNPKRKHKSLSIIALALTRSLGRKGVRVVRVHPNALDHSLGSRYCAELAVSPDMYADPLALVEWLLKLADNYPGKRVLIPASDDCAQFLGEHHAALSAAFELCAADSDVMALLVNKRHQYEHAVRLGIPIPETYFPKDAAEIDQLAGQVRNFPYILKPLVAHTWRLASMRHVSKGRKAVLVRTPDEIREAYQALGEGVKDIMLQEVIGGRDEELFTFLGYFTKDSRPLAYCVRRKIRQSPLDFGYCTMTISCHDDKVVEQSITLLQGLRYSGIVGVEYKYDAATGQYKLIEINARAVNTIGLAPACGVDVPYIAYQDLAGAAVEPAMTWRDGVAWYRIWPDFFAVRELRRRGKATYREWWKSLWGDHVEAVFAGDDLKPAWSYFGTLVLGEISARGRKLVPWLKQP